MPGLATKLDRLQVLAAFLTMLLGGLAIVLAIFVPTLLSGASVERTGTACSPSPIGGSCVILPLEPGTFLYLVVMGVLITVVVLATGPGIPVLRIIPIGAALLLWGGIMLAMASIGLFIGLCFVPAGVAAVVAAVSSAITSTSGAASPRA